MQNKFTDFLRTKHAELHPHLLDDDMPDHYDNWIADMSADELIELGNESHND